MKSELTFCMFRFKKKITEWKRRAQALVKSVKAFRQNATRVDMEIELVPVSHVPFRSHHILMSAA